MNSSVWPGFPCLQESAGAAFIPGFLGAVGSHFGWMGLPRVKDPAASLVWRTGGGQKTHSMDPRRVYLHVKETTTRATCCAGREELLFWRHAVLDVKNYCFGDMLCWT